MSTAMTLFESEDFLRAMLDTDEAVPDEQREAYERGLVAAQLAAVDKRDAVGYALARIERKLVIKTKVDGKTVELPGEIDQEIARLKELKASVQRAHDRLSAYVLDVIFTQPRDRKGDLAKLEGNTSVLSAAKCPESLGEEVDLAALPDRFKRVTVQMPLEVWHLLLSLSSSAENGKIKEIEPMRQAIKETIKAGEVVPGAKMAPVKYRLVRK